MGVEKKPADDKVNLKNKPVVPVDVQLSLSSDGDDATIIADMVTVNDIKSMSSAGKYLLQLQEMGDGVAQKEDYLLTPIKETAKRVDEFFGPAKKSINRAIDIVEKKILDYRDGVNRMIEDKNKSHDGGFLATALSNKLESDLGVVSIRKGHVVRAKDTKEVLKGILSNELPIELISISASGLKKLSPELKEKYCTKIYGETINVTLKED